MEEEGRRGGREGSHPEQSTRSARGSPASKLSLHTTTPRTQEGDRRTHVTPQCGGHTAWMPMVDFASFPQLHLQSQEGEKVIIGGISGLPSVHTVQKLYVSYVYYHCKVLDR